MVTARNLPRTGLGRYGRDHCCGVSKLTELFVNGVATAPTRTRVMYGIYLNQQWLVNVIDLVRPGENLIAIGFASANNKFDLDVFEVPCTDGELYL